MVVLASSSPLLSCLILGPLAPSSCRAGERCAGVDSLRQWKQTSPLLHAGCEGMCACATTCAYTALAFNKRVMYCSVNLAPRYLLHVHTYIHTNGYTCSVTVGKLYCYEYVSSKDST